MSNLLDEFERGDIDPQIFNHETHVQVAWLLLQQCSLLEAISRYSVALRRLTAKLGVPGKYHETTTWFLMIMIAERRAALATADWPLFRSSNMDLVKDAGNLIARYYSPERIQSETARRSYVLPDLLTISQ